MKPTASFVPLALTLLLAASPAARAATAVFDFEGQPIGTETPFSVIANGITATFSGPSTVDPGAFGISTNFPSPTGFQYRLMKGDFLTIGSAFGASGSALTIFFSAPVTTFSLDFAIDDTANASSLGFTTSAGGHAVATGSLTNGFRYPEGTLSYSGASFNSITFSSDAIDFQMDNLQVTTTTPVPEPASALLLGIGLSALAVAKRRSREPGES